MNLSRFVRGPLFSFFLIVSAALAAGAQQDPVISEIMADNSRTLADEDGEFSDWIEIHNPSGAVIDLQNYALTDDPAFLAKWRFPEVTLSAGGYVVIFASGKDRTNTAGRLHTNFQLDSDGEFLALVRLDATNIVTAFNPFPALKEDVSFGLAQKRVESSLLLTSRPEILVPTNASELPTDWNAASFLPGPNWFTGVAPPALGFDTNQASTPPSNLASGGTALQSTTFGANSANLAINGSVGDFTQTLNTDNAPFWQVTLAREAAVHRVVLRNRTSCCGSRLRDITVELLAKTPSGDVTNYASALLNPENTGFTYPNGPAFLELNLITLTGGAVPAHVVRVSRTPDPDLSGTGGQGTADEPSVLSLAEVEVIGVPLGAAEVNLARTGSPLPTAAQSSTNGTFLASLALNGNLSDFTHTLGADSNATWTLNLGRRAVINSITLHNRQSCCGSRLRDITVQILGSDTNTVQFTSPLLNPENILASPPSLTVDLSTNPVFGQFVVVRRTSDPDLSGSGGQGNADEASVLSLAEVVVLGLDVGGYRPFIRTDLQSRMLGQNASAFVRIPFDIDDPATVTDLSLRVRYDDGFKAFVNGTPIAERNAPASLSWDSAATIKRDLANALLPEVIDLSSAIPFLSAGANVLAVQGLNVSANDANFLLQPELLANSFILASNVFLTEPTPGGPNDTEFYFDEVADTQFSVERGFFDAPFTLDITSATPGAAIYYSFDSSEPGPGKGTLYTGPITITNTTVVRARAFRTNWKPTDVDTQTYLFLGDVIHQSPNWPVNGIPPQYFPASWGINRVDYGMDPNVINQHTLAEWREAFTQIPTMSVVTEMANLFDAATGIYANAFGQGEVWERPASIELLDPANPVPGRFQENCGLRIRGGASRGANFVKHSFRVFFRSEYGTGRLRYPLFEDEGAQEFDKFDLRTSQNYSWPRETSASNGTHDTMVREVFCRETLGAMGQPYRRSRYYHLYINGHYWGLYETDERPEAAYGETYFGGVQENYDVVKCGNRGTDPDFITEATDGNLVAFSNLWVMTRLVRTNSANSNYFRILGRNPDGVRNSALPVMIDVDNLIDYMLEIFYSGDGDATLSSFLSNDRPNNWFGMRDRTNPDMGFRFFNSDCEHTLGSPRSEVDRTGPFLGPNQATFLYANPQSMHQDLMLNAEYRILFADHVQKHFFNGGALTLEACTNRFIRKAVQITKAIRAYSARWGDAAPFEPPYGERDWTNEINSILTTWFPSRAGIVLQQLRLDGLYPSNGAPVFSQHGGEVTNGFPLIISHTNSSGALYYTLDGTDPRAVGGLVSGSALVYSGPVLLDGNTRVKARVLIGSVWSALTEADFAVPDLQPLRITEMMYHPTPLTQAEIAAGFLDEEDFEYIELRNVGSRTIHLAGISFVAGISFSFSGGSLAAGERVLLVKSVSAFTNRYGMAPNIAGTYGGRLDNAGERLRLQDSFGRAIHDFSYSDEWYPVTDGFGFSLTILDDTQAVSTWGNKASWRASSRIGGSPGAPNPTPPLLPFVVINELLSRPGPGQKVTVELANLSDSPADLSFWWLTDVFRTPKKFQLPNTIIPPGGYVLFTEDDFNSSGQGSNAFTFFGNAGEIRLFSADDNGELTGYYQGWDFGASDVGVTFGRHVISTGADHFVAQSNSTLLGANSLPRIGPVIITEIMYRPPDIGLIDNSADEFVELQNVSSNSVPLYDPAAPTNTWRISGGIDLNFPTNLTLAPGEYLLLVNFNPATNTAARDRFRNLYSVDPAVKLVGPYSGKLDNSGEDVEIKKPTLFPSGFPGDVLIDKVSYRDSAPWPPGADGFGLSLQRINPLAYGNDPANWTAAPNSAARTNTVGGNAPSITEQPVGQIVPTGAGVVLSVVAEGTSPLRYQWRRAGNNLANQTNSTLTLTSLQPPQSGDYLVLVYNDAGSVLSDPATVTVVAPPRITSAPQNAFVRPGVTAMFSVQASSLRALAYQWRFNDADLPGETSRTLVVNNPQPEHDGIYTVAISDGLNLPVVASARLAILVDPLIIQHPLSQGIVRGGSATLSIVVSNTATFPITYRWRRGSSFFRTNIVNSYMDFLTISNVQPVANTTNFFVVVSNYARPSILSSTAFITVLPDNDNDGLADPWEIDYGFDTNTVNEAGDDADEDTMLNWQEQIAGTDPTNNLSLFKIDFLSSNPGTTRLEFQGVSNRTYTVEYQPVLGPPVWTKLIDLPARATNSVQITFDSNAAPSTRYYRLVTPRQP